MKYFSADIIYTNTSDPLHNHVIVTDDLGTISDIQPKEAITADIRHIHGAIVPGFVNAHCHLELSHLKDQLNTGTGLIPFIKSVVTLRDFPQDVINQAIENADQEMYDNGIVAVGDISNKADTAFYKSKSKINYYTFVEMFDFLQDTNAQTTFDQYKEVYDAHSDENGNKKSCVPHAPYSVSPTLFKLINEINNKISTVSLHNQETWHENQFFLTKEGELIDFYNGFGISLDKFNPLGEKSISYAMRYMDADIKTLLVHNTMSDIDDITSAHKWNEQCYWVTCPNANLFIENKMPNYKTFIDAGAKMCIGTDSLSSNWQLCILEELKTIEKYQSYISTETLIKWSSHHAAEALGYAELGSIEIGKKPGLIALEAPYKGHFKLNEVKNHYRLL